MPTVLSLTGSLAPSSSGSFPTHPHVCASFPKRLATRPALPACPALAAAVRTWSRSPRRTRAALSSRREGHTRRCDQRTPPPAPARSVIVSNGTRVPRTPHSDTSGRIKKASRLRTCNFGPKASFISAPGRTAMLAESTRALGCGGPPGPSTAPTASHRAAARAGGRLKSPCVDQRVTAHTRTRHESGPALSPRGLVTHPLACLRCDLPSSFFCEGSLSKQKMTPWVPVAWGAEAAMQGQPTETLPGETAPRARPEPQAQGTM